MHTHGMHGDKLAWRTARDQELDEFVADAAGAKPAPEPDIWDVEAEKQD